MSRWWFRLRDADGTWGFFLSYYARSKLCYVLSISCSRVSFAWAVPECGEWTWARYNDGYGRWHADPYKRRY